uniref:Large ribosomal subunit protein uL23c n=1 Tax=Phacus inflexus TaxID=461210 RepID=A0A3G3LKT1_9EUGL|nr:ribosomal protein L23 [Phacus inflexus]AYQ93316.1 ribosomal protein L23 [Phacus inflexus]
MIDMFKYPLFTDKTNKLLQINKYTFLTDVKFTKTMAINIIEDIFSVKVVSINTSILSSKKRRLGKFLGFKNSFKRILITLSSGQFIPFF